MKKILISFLTFLAIGILAGILYMLISSQNESLSDIDTNIPPSIQSGMIQSGTVILSLPVQMSGGVALDPYRDNSVSGSQQLYKGVPIMPAVEIHLDCSTSATEANRLQCEQFKANIERTQKAREATMQQSGSTNTGTLSTGSSAPMNSF